ncbi:tetratricopeptide repeat protein [Tenacibaculum dicentrarchi]|uniref:tetratricopeptide repeat protein n=1 Tax=Tenacibaculum dicentrarchi TaxID=669041 RepID=UPI000C7BC1B9
MTLKNILTITLFIFCFNSYSQETNIASNKKQQSILNKIDSIQNTKSETDKTTQFKLGEFYYDLFANEFDWYGGNDFDKVKAKNWFEKSIILLEKSAKQGFSEAYLSLGKIYENTPDYNGDIYNYNDTNKAIYWFKKLLEQRTYEYPGYIMHELGLIYKTGHRGDTNLKDDKIALKWFEKAASNGRIESMKKLGDMYYYGNGVSEDDEKAFYWYKKCVEESDFTIYNNDLAVMYYYGTGTTKSIKKAYDLFKESAEKSGYKIGNTNRYHSNATACYYIGIMYYLGEHLEKNYDKSFWWIETAAMNGDTDASSLLGYMYYYGQGTLVDKQLAFTWLKYSEKNKDNCSQYLLGTMYYYGEVTTVDYKKSAYYMKKAFENGSKEAKEFWDKKELWKYK